MTVQRALYSVYDDKACFFASPFYAMNHSDAIRSFSDAVADPQTRVSIHPSDYVLYHIGTFDDVSGSLIPLDKPQFLSRGSEHVSRSEVSA